MKKNIRFLMLGALLWSAFTQLSAQRPIQSSDLGNTLFTENFDWLNEIKGSAPLAFPDDLYETRGIKLVSYSKASIIPSYFTKYEVDPDNLTNTNGIFAETNLSFYSVGLKGSSNRALGSCARAAWTGGWRNYMLVVYENKTGSTITSFDINYTIEKWLKSLTLPTNKDLCSSYFQVATSQPTVANPNNASINPGSSWITISKNYFTGDASTAGSIEQVNGKLMENQTTVDMKELSVSLPDGSSIYFLFQFLPALSTQMPLLSIDDLSLKFYTGTAKPEFSPASTDSYFPLEIGQTSSSTMNIISSNLTQGFRAAITSGQPYFQVEKESFTQDENTINVLYKGDITDQPKISSGTLTFSSEEFESKSVNLNSYLIKTALPFTDSFSYPNNSDLKDNSEWIRAFVGTQNTATNDLKVTNNGSESYIQIPEPGATNDWDALRGFIRPSGNTIYAGVKITVENARTINSHNNNSILLLSDLKSSYFNNQTPNLGVGLNPKGIDEKTFKFGLSNSDNYKAEPAPDNYFTGAYNYGETYQVILKLELIPVEGETPRINRTSLFINPENSSIEPTATLVSDYSTETMISQLPNAIILGQSLNSAKAKIHEVKVGTSWQEMINPSSSNRPISEVKKDYIVQTKIEQTLQLNHCEQVQQITIRGIDGRVVFADASPSQTIDVSNLPSGIYLVRITSKTQQNESVYKIVKQ